MKIEKRKIINLQKTNKIKKIMEIINKIRNKMKVHNHLRQQQNLMQKIEKLILLILDLLSKKRIFNYFIIFYIN